jgi:RHS repeat-associated protein
MLAAQPQSAYAYALDKVGNRTRVIETRAAFDGSATPVVLTHTYDYDALNRLTNAATDTPVSDTAYTFDSVGNRLAKTGAVLAPDPGTPELPVAPRPEAVSSTYNAANQLTAVSRQQSAISLEYDRNGNRTHETEVLTAEGKTLLTEYRYDFENRLVGVTTSTNNVVTMEAAYTYDGYGRRVQKQVSNLQSPISNLQMTYLYDGLDIIGAQLEQGGTTEETYYYLAPSPLTGLRRPLAMEQLSGGDRYWYQTDGLDSIVALTNENGRLVSPFLYNEYGQILAGDTDLQIFTYTAQDYDPETKLVHFYARYYDPARGVWLTQDPYRGNLNYGLTLHRYSYVSNNSVSRIDIYGFAFVECEDCNINLWNIQASKDQECSEGIVKFCSETATLGTSGDLLTVGLDDQGEFQVGPQLEAFTYKMKGDIIVGDDDLGLNVGGGHSGPSFEAFAGIKDNKLGASAGVTFLSADIHTGLNIFGLNVGIKAEGKLGLETGMKLGQGIELCATVVLGGCFGLTFGKATETQYRDGVSPTAQTADMIRPNSSSRCISSYQSCPKFEYGCDPAIQSCSSIDHYKSTNLSTYLSTVISGPGNRKSAVGAAVAGGVVGSTVRFSSDRGIGGGGGGSW